MENGLVALSNELAAVVEKAGGNVVAVHGRPRIPSSGVLWKPGVVVTAEHALRRDEELKVTLADGQSLKAEVAGRDPGTDLAVLRVEGAPGAALTPVQDLRAGNLMLTLGRTADRGVTAALGVISSVSGEWQTWRGGSIEQFIRLDIGLYAGSSGGAVVSASGEFVGIATAGLSRTSIIAVPAKTIARVVDALLERGHISRGFLGVGLQPVPLPQHLRTQLEWQEKAGLIVLSVEPEGPAAQAGVVIGDVLIALNGKTVSDTGDVQAALGPETVGKAVKADVIRAGARTELAITVGERPRRRA